MIQLKKGFLDIIVLAALMEKDSYGYKIIQDISDVIEVSESTLYPVLRRLEVQGLLTTYTYQHGGRLRKYYSITPAGIARVYGFTDDWRQLKKAYDFVLSKLK